MTRQVLRVTLYVYMFYVEGKYIIYTKDIKFYNYQVITEKYQWLKER